eukprot:3641135-Pyramimonas_sp.AAC.1
MERSKLLSVRIFSSIVACRVSLSCVACRSRAPRAPQHTPSRAGRTRPASSDRGRRCRRRPPRRRACQQWGM